MRDAVRVTQKQRRWPLGCRRKIIKDTPELRPNVLQHIKIHIPFPFSPFTLSAVEMSQKLRARWGNEWMGCLPHNWKHSLINDFVHAGVRISSPCWEGGFCIISWFALIIAPYERQACHVFANSLCLMPGECSARRNKMYPPLLHKTESFPV